MVDKKKQFDPTATNHALVARDRIIDLERVSAAMAVVSQGVMYASHDLKHSGVPTDNPLHKAMEELCLATAKVTTLNASLLTRLKR